MRMLSLRMTRGLLCGRHLKNITRACSFDNATYIKENTEITRDHLTPEIKLHLITPSCHLWNSPPEDCQVPDPFWAFYWPGGQALSRYILDHKDLVSGRNVLDVGCGCGASSIASAMVGATTVTANDICQVALQAVRMNAKLNNVKLDYCGDNLLGKACQQWDLVIVGDMLYDMDFSTELLDWLEQLISQHKDVLIGDPGRAGFTDLKHPFKSKLKRLEQYTLSEIAKRENNGILHSHVYLASK